MIYGIFSDVHSNKEAFDVVMEFYGKNWNIDYYLFCGDIVGYGPEPKECIDKIMQMKNLYAVMGNHESVLVNKKSISQFNEYAKETLLWTKKNIEKEQLEFLNQLSQIVEIKDITLVHASPTKPLEGYILSSQQCLNNINKFSTRICFIGHTHEPFVFGIDKDKNISFTMLKFDNDKYELKLNKETRYIVNVGSVGQPRDGNPKSCCVIYDDVKDILIFYRLQYNIEQVQKKMEKFFLPKFLIQRLSYGQ